MCKGEEMLLYTLFTDMPKQHILQHITRRWCTHSTLLRKKCTKLPNYWRPTNSICCSPLEYLTTSLPVTMPKVTILILSQPLTPTKWLFQAILRQNSRPTWAHISKCLLGQPLLFMRLQFPDIDKKKCKKGRHTNFQGCAKVLSPSRESFVHSLQSHRNYLEEVTKCFSVLHPYCSTRLSFTKRHFLITNQFFSQLPRTMFWGKNVFVFALYMDSSRYTVLLLMVGKLGSWKSLSKTIAVDAMEDMLSRKSFVPNMQGGPDSIFSMQPPFKAGRDCLHFSSVCTGAEVKRYGWVCICGLTED